MNGFIIQYFPDGGIAIVNAGNAEAPSAFLGVLLVLLFAVPAWRACADFRRRWAQGNRAARLNLLAMSMAFGLAISIHGSGKQSATNLMFGGSTQNTVTNTVNSGGTGQQSGINGSGTFSSTRSSLLPSDYVQGGMPSWWQYDPTSTVVEGVPDLWLKWTRYDAALYGTDPGVDRDGDGLNELEEFWWACDPRTESTMDTGYPDGWAVASDIDPLDPGIAWQDLSGDGLTTIEAYHFGKDPWDSTPIPPITLANGAKGVTFTLDTPIPQGSVAIFTLAGQSCPLTASSNSVTVLLPADGVTHGSFTPPAGMGDVGLSLSGQAQGLYAYDPYGVFGAPTPAYQSGGMGVMSPGGNGFSLEYIDFSITPSISTTHGEGVGFSALGVTSALVTWKTEGADGEENGTMSPATGLHSTLNDHSYAGDTKVIATLSSGGGSISATAKVERCTMKDYHPPSVSFAGTSDGFSPHLGEACGISAKFAPGYWRWTCNHPNAPDEMEHGSVADLRICREVGSYGNWWALQILDNYIDIDPAPSVSRNWDGKVGTGQQTSPEQFTTNGVPLFNRILPASSGVIPPPFFHVVARIWRNGNTAADPAIVASKKVFVPQIVKVRYDQSAVEALTNKIEYTYSFAGTIVDTNLYSGCTINEAVVFLNNELPGLIQQKYAPTDANIIFVGNDADVPGAHEILVTGSVGSSPFGFANRSSMNAQQPNTSGRVYAWYINNYAILNTYHLSITVPNEIAYTNPVTQSAVTYSEMCANIPYPLSLAMVAKIYAGTGAHEPAHQLGLGLDSSSGYRNSDNDPQFIMHPESSFDWRLEIYGARQFNGLNSSFLKWLLPKPQ